MEGKQVTIDFDIAKISWQLNQVKHTGVVRTQSVRDFVKLSKWHSTNFKGIRPNFPSIMIQLASNLPLEFRAYWPKKSTVKRQILRQTHKVFPENPLSLKIQFILEKCSKSNTAHQSESKILICVSFPPVFNEKII